MQKTIIRPRKRSKAKKIKALAVCLMAIYFSTFIWGFSHPYGAAAVQLASTAWLMLIAHENGLLIVDL